MTRLAVTSAGLISASESDTRAGLLGYVSCVVGDVLLLDGITLRRTSDGRLTLSYPARRDSRGRQHAYVRPIDDASRRDLEAQIFARLGIEQEASL